MSFLSSGVFPTWRSPSIFRSFCDNTYPGRLADFSAINEQKAWNGGSQNEVAHEVKFVSNTRGSFLKGVTFCATQRGNLKLSIECEPKDSMRLASYLEDKGFKIDDASKGSCEVHFHELEEIRKLYAILVENNRFPEKWRNLMDRSIEAGD